MRSRAPRRSSGSESAAVMVWSPTWDLDGAAAACGADELADRPARLGFDPAADGEGGERDGQVGFDGVALVVVDGPGLQVVLGHPEGLRTSSHHNRRNHRSAAYKITHAEFVSQVGRWP